GHSAREGESIGLGGYPHDPESHQGGDGRPRGQHPRPGRLGLWEPLSDPLTRCGVPWDEDRHLTHDFVREAVRGSEVRQALQRIHDAPGFGDLGTTSGALAYVRLQWANSKAHLLVDDQVDLFGE